MRWLLIAGLATRTREPGLGDVRVRVRHGEARGN